MLETLFMVSGIIFFMLLSLIAVVTMINEIIVQFFIDHTGRFRR